MTSPQLAGIEYLARLVRAQTADVLPAAPGRWAYEPKFDGFLN